MRTGIEMLNQELPVMGGHFAIMLPGERIGRLFCALLEHFGFLPKNRCFGHGLLLGWLLSGDNYVLVALAQRGTGKA